MKKIIALLLCALFLSGCEKSSIEKIVEVESMNAIEEKETVRLGYCPTMKNDAYNLRTANRNLEIVEFGSAEETLNNLKLNRIDFALVGRKAKQAELAEEISEFNLENQGYTLIAPQKQIVLELDLADLRISSCQPLGIKDIYPELNLVFKDCDYRNGEVWLIAWNELTDDLELLIPVNEHGEKNRKFRGTFLYADSGQGKLNY